MLKRIMIVDDDPAILDDYAELLREEGYMVTTAANGAEALQRLRASEPLSLIMLDLRMPVMDGHSFNAMLRKDPTFDHVPVVLLSGAVEILAEVDRMGASGFLAKPATVTELLGTVQTFCGPS